MSENNDTVNSKDLKFDYNILNLISMPLSYTNLI